jgi:putative membrane protein insertion efficiency factor
MIKRLLMAVVKAYRFLLSPWLGTSCRFEPTCSVYSLQALDRFGAAKGSYLTLMRLGRCHPWCEGGIDPVPDSPVAGQTDVSTRLIYSSTQKKSS